MGSGSLFRALPRFAALLAMVALETPSTSAGSFTVYGPATFVRQPRAPQIETVAFDAPETDYLLRVESDGVASAILTLNGAVIVGTGDFDRRARVIEREVALAPHNELQVDLRGAPGGTLRVSIAGRDTAPPAITASVSPAPNAAGWHASDVTVTFRCTDAVSGVESCPPPVVVSEEGANTAIAGTATDRAGNSASTEIIVNVDKTAPTVASEVSPPPAPSGWHSTPATATFACEDALSGVAECPSPRAFADEGAGQTAEVTVTDLAGNAATANVAVSVDLTPPAVRAMATPDKVTNGDVTVRFECEDALSGVAECPEPRTIAAEGMNQAVSGAARDRAGHAAEATVAVSIDRTKPAIAATVSPDANAAGWHRETAVVSFACEDAGAGVAACTEPVTVTEEGAGQQAAGAASDHAGNTTETTATVNLDRTPPALTLSNGGGVVRHLPFAIGGTAADALSGLASVSCGGTPAVLAGGSFSCDVTLPPGPSSVAVVAVDSAGNQRSASLDVVFDPNQSPSANAGGPYSGETGEPIAFDGSASSDPDGQTLVYAWSFGDGGSASGAEPSHAYAEPGTYTVTLTVTDPDGATATAISVATVVHANRTPVANAGGPYAADAGVAITFSGAASTDPDGDALSYSWTFGDGGAGAGVNPRRTYANAGTYTATLTVSDGRGESDSAAATVTIRAPNQRPAARAGGPYEARAGEPVTLDASASADPDGDALTFSWTFGDGGTGGGSSVSHTFAAAGVFTVSLTVHDGRGGSDSSSTIVTVQPANADPQANAGGPYTAVVGEAVTFDGGASTDPDGDPLTYSWSFGDGRSRTGASPTHAYDAPGTFTATLTVADGRGGSGTASAQVGVAAAPPRENRPPAADAGGPYTGEPGLPVTFDASQSADPDGDALSFAWTSSDGAAGAGVTFAHAFPEQKTYTVTLVVSDAHGATDQAAATVAIGPRSDRAPPVIAIAGPAEALPGSHPTVTAVASDDVGVAAVRFEVGGGSPLDVTAPPYQRVIDVPAVAAPGTTISIRATARDAAGHSTSASHAIKIVAQPDTVAPAVTIGAPVRTAPGVSMELSATASDNVGVESVTFRVNGAPVATDTTAPYQAAFAVPGGTAPGTTLQVTAEASDFAGNRSMAAAAVEVAPDTDTTPPSVSLEAPATAAPGETVVVGASASDVSGIAALTFTVDGAVFATLTEAPYQAQFVMPALPDGALVRIQAQALDFAGLSSTNVRDVRVAALEPGEGLIVGEVYDDTTGLPVPGASARLVSPEGPAASTETDTRGRYVLPAPAGSAVVEIALEGWTIAQRVLTVVSGRAAEALDARIVPLSAAAVPVTPVLGGEIVSGTVRLHVPAGAVATAVALRLTPFGPHALIAPTPPGWTPLAAADLSPHEAAFAQPAVLQAALPQTVSAGVSLVFARWDAAAGAWRTVSTTELAGDAGSMTGEVGGGGQYAWLRPDVVPAAPPLPAAGALVEGVASIDLDASAAAQVTPQPKVLFYEPGVHSTVRSAISMASPVPSGAWLWSRVVESYQFRNGSSMSLEPFVQDLAFFQTPADPATLEARYVVTPSAAFEAASLESGEIANEVVVPPAGGRSTGVVTASGGRVETESGEALDVPAGLAAPVAVQIARLAPDELGVPLPADLEFAGGAAVSFAGIELTVPGALSIPKPTSLPPDVQLLLVRAQELQGRTELVLVGLGSVSADRIVAVLVLPKNGVPFEGVRRGGRYAFVRPLAPVGFAAGKVLAGNGTAVAGARVSTATLPIVALSRGAAGYIAAARTGSISLSALDPATSDEASAPLALAAAGDEAALDLRLIAQPPRVVAVQPAGGARNVPLASAVSVVFSEPVEPASILASGRLSLASAVGAGVPGTVSLSAANTIATFRPASPLEPDTEYTFIVAAAIADRSGRTLGAPVTVQFTSLDTMAPPPPAAGGITAAIPDADGFSTVRGTQGTAGAHDTVTIENLTTGAITPVVLDPNGGFLVRVAARQSDRLQIRIADQAGNETVLALPRFSRTNPDGSVSSAVDASGGRVTGPDGVALDIAEGTFTDSVIVTLKALGETAFPVQLSDAQRQVLAYAGGLEIDFGGAEPRRYLDISVPAGASDRPTDQWIVARAASVNGIDTFDVVDLALLEGGRITTASPPCPGVTGSGVYGIYKSSRDVGLNYGELYHNDPNGGFRLDVEPMVPTLPLGVPLLFPALVPRQQASFCMPVLSGNLSIAENAIELEIPPQQITPADRSIVVQTTSVPGGGASARTARYSFPRNILELAFQVPGTEDMPFEVVLETLDGSTVQLGSSQIASIRQDPGAETVTIRLNMDKLAVTPKTVIIRNLGTAPPTETSFEQAATSIRLSVAGSPADALRVFAIDAEGIEREIASYEVLGSTYPAGNLALRAVTGTIDPTPEQIDEYNSWPPCGPDQAYPCRGEILDRNHGVVRLMLADEHSASVGTDPANGGTPCGHAVCMDVPLASLTRGAVVFPFTGDRTHRHGVHVFYLDGTRDYLPIAGFTLTVTDIQTGQVIKAITAQAPARAAPQNLGRITNDRTMPVVIGGPPRFEAYDPSRPLTFTFSEAISEASALKAFLVDATGRRIAIASVIISPDGRQVTFVPAESLELGASYTLDLSEVTDLAGNRVLSRAISLRTFEPRRLCPNGGGCPAVDTGAFDATIVRGADIRANGSARAELEPIADIAYYRGADPAPQSPAPGAPAPAERTNLVLTLGGFGTTDYRLSVFDVTDPQAAFEKGRGFGGRGKRRVSLLLGLEDFPVASGTTPSTPNTPHVFANPPESDPCYVENQRFTGNIALTSSYTPDMGYLTFFDVTDPWQPCVLGEKLLTASPWSLDDFNRQGTIHASGLARAVVPIRHDAGIAVFTAVQQVGVTRTDLGQNIPSRYPASRLDDGLYAGDVVDLAGFRDKLLVARRDGPLFDILDANLNRIGSIDLPERPVRVLTAENYAFDANRDGSIAAREIRHLAFVATDTCSGGTAPGMPACSAHVQVVDLTTLSAPQIIGRYTLPGAVFSMDVDPAHQRLLVGGSRWPQHGGGHSLYAIDISKPDEMAMPDADADGWDDRIVWRRAYAAARPNAVRIDKERGLAYVGLSYTTGTGLERGAIDIFALFDECCDLGVDFRSEPETVQAATSRQEVILREKRALVQGIKAALDEAAATWGAIPGLAIMEQGSGACIWRGEHGDCDDTYQPGFSDHDFEVFFPNLPADDPAPALPLGVNCTVALLNYTFTKAIALPGGPVALHDVTFYPVSMAEYQRGFLGVQPAKRIDPLLCNINEPAAGSDPGGDLGMGRQQLLLKWLLEGQYITGVDGLVEPDRRAIYGLLRMGRDQRRGIPRLEGWEWARLMEYNLARARVYVRIPDAADPDSAFHDLFRKQIHDAGKIGIRAALARMVASGDETRRARLLDGVDPATFLGPACLDILPEVPSTQWPAARCRSFEHYVATAAVKTGLFDEEAAQLIGRFYRVKAGTERILTAAAADQFIAAVDRFVLETGALTRDVYLSELQVGDRYYAQRVANATAVEQQIFEATTKARIQVAPRVFNHGFRNADAVALAMYRGAGSSFTQIKSLPVSLTGGETRTIRLPGDGGTPVALRNLNDLSDIDPLAAGNRPHFVLGSGAPGDPPINQMADFGVLKTVAFTLDLPTQSGERGHKVREPNRENNYGGFHYYVLDRAAPAPVASGPVPLPVNDPSALQPDAECFVAPQLRVASQAIDYSAGTLTLKLVNTSNEKISSVQVCSDLAGVCTLVGDIAAGQLIEVSIALPPPSSAGTYGSNVTVYGRTAGGQDVRLTWSSQLQNAGAPFDVKAYDRTPLNDLEHPFSRWTANRDGAGRDTPIRGATADGTERAVQLRIGNLRPGIPAIVRLVDPDTAKLAAGSGHLETGTEPGEAHSPTVAELRLTPGDGGALELYYTPPAAFIRDGSQNADFRREERTVRITVIQDGIGMSSLDLSLRRPPVFLAHGLWGDIHVWRDFQPLVPPPDALGNARLFQYRPGYDGRFDLFVVGEPAASHRVAVDAEQLRAHIGGSLAAHRPGYAIGKIDVVGHSMGGVLARKLTNEHPPIRDAVRKLILLNSPQGGSPLADKIVELRNKLPVSYELPKPQDFLNLDPSKVTDLKPFAGEVKVEWCEAMLQALGRTLKFNMYRGAVDDLRTILADAQGQPTEVGKLVNGGWNVPTHHIVDTTTTTDLGLSQEVLAMWAGLGILCNLTPHADTVEATVLLRQAVEAVKALATLFRAANATRTLHKRAFGSLESKKILLDLLKGTLKKAARELRGEIEDPPAIVFTTTNDRVVPAWSQLGNGVSAPNGGPLGNGHPAVTEVFGETDHQAAKITPAIPLAMCATVDAQTGVLAFDDRVADLNGDGTPDPVCRIMSLLEADPAGESFYKAPKP